MIWMNADSACRGSIMNRVGTGWRQRLSPGCLGSALLFLSLSPCAAQQDPSLPRARLGPPELEETRPGVFKPGDAAQSPSVFPSSKVLPISLDTVLRLAQDRNGQMAIARQRLEEAFAQQDVAAKKCIPDLTVGTAYYRHEGGI